MSAQADLIIIGAGFYGLRLALRYGAKGMKITVLDRLPEAMTKASYINQARVHNGYHYPRSYITAKASHDNYQRFMREYPECVDNNFTHLYAVARSGSQISEYQFQQFCEIVGSPLLPVRPDEAALFNQDRIAAVFRADEVAFDAAALRRTLLAEISAYSNIAIHYNTDVTALDQTGGAITVTTNNGDFTAPRVLNVSYSNLNDIIRRARFLEAEKELLNIDIEIAEVALCTAPPELQHIGITIMDGPFWATLPFPADRLRSLTHVRYTPHTSYSSRQVATPPEEILSAYHAETNFYHMRADAARYVPAVAEFQYARSLFTNKAILANHDHDDARPILLKCHSREPVFISVLGSKLDSIYALEEAMADYLD